MRRLLNILLILPAKALATPLIALAVAPLVVFAGFTTFLASVVIAHLFAYAYTNIGLRFVASYLSGGQRYPTITFADVQAKTDSDTPQNRMTPPSSPSNSDSGAGTPPPPLGPLPNYMGINYVRPRRRRSTSAAHSRRRQPFPEPPTSPPPPPQQPQQPPRPTTSFPKPRRPPTCSCISSPSGLLSPSLRPTSPSSTSSRSSSSGSNNNTWTLTTTTSTTRTSSSASAQLVYDSYTELYRRHCERCFEKRALWFSAQRSSEGLRAVVEVGEGAAVPTVPAAVAALDSGGDVSAPAIGSGGGGEASASAAVVDALPRVVIPRAVPERAGAGQGAAAVVEAAQAGEGGSESGSSISELDLADGRAGSGSPGPVTVSTSLVSTPPEALVDKGKGKDKSS